MKKYYNPENERVRYVVRETLNGYVPTMLNTQTGDMVAITPKTAAQYELRLPDIVLGQACTRQAAERYLDRIARLNGWTALETQER